MDADTHSDSQSPNLQPDTPHHSISSRTKPRPRNQNACDACRTRKVKCIYDGDVCRACIELNVACTRWKPRRKRGPPNSYAEAERRKVAQVVTASPVASPAEYPDILAQLASLEVIRRIVEDWFEFIHSVAPVFHYATFMSRLLGESTRTDTEFVAVVISVCAATVGCLKKTRSIHYGNVTVDRCFQVIQQNKLLESPKHVTLEWCQACYHIGTTLSGERGMQDVDGFRFFNQSAGGVKYLLHYQLDNMSFVDQQLLKRLYWLLFAGNCSVEMLGGIQINILSPHDNISLLRPETLTDLELVPESQTQSLNWHGNTVSYIPGLNHLSDLFLVWHASQQHHNQNIHATEELMAQLQRTLDVLPAPLRWRGGLSRPVGSNFGTDVQIVNLYITQLQIRSNLLEQMRSLRVKQYGFEGEANDIVAGRERVVDDLLEILYHMPAEVFEANGFSILPKSRDIGAGLLTQLEVDNQNEKGQMIGEKARRKLTKLLERLEELDFVPGMSNHTP